MRNLPAFATAEIREFLEDAPIVDMVSEGRAPAMSWAVWNGGRWKIVHGQKRMCDLPVFSTIEITEYSEGDAQLVDMASEDRAPTMS
jgi:hypothetical protein